jgi:hypothetical protein
MLGLVYSGVGQKAQQYYANYVNSANIKTVFSLAAEHTFVSICCVLCCMCLISVYFRMLLGTD